MKKMILAGLFLAVASTTIAVDAQAQVQPEQRWVVMAPFVLDRSVSALSDSVIGLALSHLDTLTAGRDLRFRARQDVNALLSQSDMSAGIVSVNDMRLLTQHLAARGAVGISVERRPSDYRVVATFVPLQLQQDPTSVQLVATDLTSAARLLAQNVAGSTLIRR